MSESTAWGVFAIALGVVLITITIAVAAYRWHKVSQPDPPTAKVELVCTDTPTLVCRTG